MGGFSKNSGSEGGSTIPYEAGATRQVKQKSSNYLLDFNPCSPGRIRTCDRILNRDPLYR